jgi:hypothetical protein
MFTSEELKVIFLYDRGMDIHDIVEQTGMTALKVSSIVTKYISLPQEEFDTVTNQLDNEYYNQVYDTY